VSDPPTRDPGPPPSGATRADLPPYDAVVLAGGRARRLGGIDKPGLDVAGRPLAARVVAAVGGAGRVVLAGPERPAVVTDVTVREEPPGSGPVAALAAALPHVTAEVVALLAGDLPFLDPATVDALRGALQDARTDARQGAEPAPRSRADAALAVDADGRAQLLLAVWDARALRRRLDDTAPHAGAPVRRLYDGAATVEVPLPTEAGAPPPWFDLDTPDDVRTARGWT
jgi:molybdenum cofactor guanylyltransferase